MDPSKSVWTEKYRPTKIEDMVGDFKEQILNYLKEPEAMQNLLFYSVAPGTGKTTLAKAIVKHLGADVLFLNASDDRKIETVREKVKEFVQTKSSVNNLRRIVFMDEADGMTKQAQEALKTLMESYSTNALFILTCNTIGSIDVRVRSRCKEFEFSRPHKHDIYEYLEKICKAENMNYTEEGLNHLIDINYPSIRNCVQALQSLYTQKKDVVKENAKASDEEFQLLWDKIHKDKDWKFVTEYIWEHEIDNRALNKFFWFKAVSESLIKIMQVADSNEHKFSQGADENIVFITSLTNMI